MVSGVNLLFGSFWVPINSIVDLGNEIPLLLCMAAWVLTFL